MQMLSDYWNLVSVCGDCNVRITGATMQRSFSWMLFGPRNYKHRPFNFLFAVRSSIRCMFSNKMSWHDPTCTKSVSECDQLRSRTFLVEGYLQLRPRITCVSLLKQLKRLLQPDACSIFWPKRHGSIMKL